MNRKEFIVKYPSIRASYSFAESWSVSKALKVIKELEKEDRLDIFAYCEVMVKEVDIVRFSGLCLATVKNYKKGKTTLPFVYAALREKSVKSLVEEFEKDLL